MKIFKHITNSLSIRRSMLALVTACLFLVQHQAINAYYIMLIPEDNFAQQFNALQLEISIQFNSIKPGDGAAVPITKKSSIENIKAISELHNCIQLNKLNKAESQTDIELPFECNCLKYLEDKYENLRTAYNKLHEKIEDRNRRNSLEDEHGSPFVASQANLCFTKDSFNSEEMLQYQDDTDGGSIRDSTGSIWSTDSDNPLKSSRSSLTSSSDSLYSEIESEPADTIPSLLDECETECIELIGTHIKLYPLTLTVLRGKEPYKAHISLCEKNKGQTNTRKNELNDYLVIQKIKSQAPQTFSLVGIDLISRDNQKELTNIYIVLKVQENKQLRKFASTVGLDNEKHIFHITLAKLSYPAGRKLKISSQEESEIKGKLQQIINKYQHLIGTTFATKTVRITTEKDAEPLNDIPIGSHDENIEYKEALQSLVYLDTFKNAPSISTSELPGRVDMLNKVAQLYLKTTYPKDVTNTALTLSGVPGKIREDLERSIIRKLCYPSMP